MSTSCMSGYMRFFALTSHSCMCAQYSCSMPDHIELTSHTTHTHEYDVLVVIIVCFRAHTVYGFSFTEMNKSFEYIKLKR